MIAELEQDIGNVQIEYVKFNDCYRLTFPDANNWKTLIGAERLAKECKRYGVQGQVDAIRLLVSLARSGMPSCA